MSSGWKKNETQKRQNRFQLRNRCLERTCITRQNYCYDSIISVHALSRALVGKFFLFFFFKIHTSGVASRTSCTNFPKHVSLGYMLNVVSRNVSKLNQGCDHISLLIYLFIISLRLRHLYLGDH